MRRFWIFAAILGLSSAGAVRGAEQIELTKGRLFQSGSYAIQTVGAVNNTGKTVDLLEVECGFFRRGALIRAGGGVAQHVEPGQKAFFDVRSSDASDADSTECRVSTVR